MIWITITVTSKWARWHLKSLASRFFTQLFIQAQIKENIKAPRHWPLWGEFIGTGEFPAPKTSSAENASVWWCHHGSCECFVKWLLGPFSLSVMMSYHKISSTLAAARFGFRLSQSLWIFTCNSAATLPRCRTTTPDLAASWLYEI